VGAGSGQLGTPFSRLQPRRSRPYNERSDDDSTLSVIRTRAGGAPSEPAISVGTVQGSSFPALAVAQDGPFPNRLYVAAIRGRSVVLFSSRDEGRTWQGPAIVRNIPSVTDGSIATALFNPAVAVNRNGIGGVAWAEGTRARDGFYIRSWTYRMAASWDGGATFSDNVSVSSDGHEASRVTRVPLTGSIGRDGRERQHGSVVVD